MRKVLIGTLAATAAVFAFSSSTEARGWHISSKTFDRGEQLAFCQTSTDITHAGVEIAIIIALGRYVYDDQFVMVIDTKLHSQIAFSTEGGRPRRGKKVLAARGSDAESLESEMRAARVAWISTPNTYSIGSTDTEVDLTGFDAVADECHRYFAQFRPSEKEVSETD